jgi:UDP-N-acetylglucosamine acyltransferase
MHHPLSVIHPNAVIGKDVYISPFVTIEENVVIGDGTWIGPSASIMSGARIGKNCKIFSGAVVSSIPQDLKFNGEPTTLEVGDNTVIREYCTLNRGTAANKKTIIGSSCLLMSYVHVAHDCEISNNCILANNATLAGHVKVDEHTIIGGMVAIQQFTHIGAYSMLGGGVLLNKDVPPFVRVARYPASFIGVNVVGLKRNGFDQNSIQKIQEVYRQLFVVSQNRSQALNIIENILESSEELKTILSFVNNSKNGIIKGLRKGM